MNLVFLGPPGAGKGTQAGLVSEYFDIPHISSGDIFRKNIFTKTNLGKKAKEFIDKGVLVPDKITNTMVKLRLERNDCKDGFILDGYPRTVAQADFLSGITDISCVINFILSKEEIVKRISGRRTCKKCRKVYHVEFNPPDQKSVCDECAGELIQRSDESPEIIRKRLKEYKKKTAPLENYYKKEDLLVEMDASPSINEIFNDVKKILKKVSRL
ncbi:adenylate kinase [Candidatus Woesearchaeota archaeon]|nr:adenylate kinase [Candidatus Woesearchaeota archaeon]